MKTIEILSMTGFARHEFEFKNSSYVFNLKSVNGRFLELKVRLPRPWADLEIEIRNFLGQRVRRGTAEFWIDATPLKTLSSSRETENRVQKLLMDFSTAILASQKLKKLPVKRNEIFEIILRNPAEWANNSSPETEANEDRISFENIKPALENLLNSFASSRKAEGQKISTQFHQGIEHLGALHTQITNEQTLWRETWEENMRKRISELSAQSGVNPPSEERILQEILILAEKRDIKEEIERIGFHLSKLRAIFEGQAVSTIKDKDFSKGKEIDFFLQELNREWTTLGNKIQRPDSAQKMVDSKLILEQLREQALNVL